MAIIRRFAKETSPRRFYCFIDGMIEAITDRPHSRVALHLDAVDADAFDLDPEAIAAEDALYLLKVATTANRLEQLTTRPVKETDWLEVTVQRRRNTPAAWIKSSAGDGLGNQTRLNAPQIRPVETLDDGLLGRLQKACSSQQTAKADAPDEALMYLFMQAGPSFRIEALDVGQAACVAFYSGTECLGYFDVGAPIWFNNKSYPVKLDHNVAKKGFVLLSHWDFDHYAMALREQGLRSLNWYAPDQPVGPNTAKFQRLLDGRLTFITGNVTYGASPGSPVLQLLRCTGNPGDRNRSGYVLRLDYSGQAVLLTGDADYDSIPPSVQSALTAILIPHHGGNGAAPVPHPGPGRRSRAVASYGIPNAYRHPSEDRLQDHDLAEWAVHRTARHGTAPKVPRGNRRLYPLP